MVLRTNCGPTNEAILLRLNGLLHVVASRLIGREVIDGDHLQMHTGRMRNRRREWRCS
jgi:hypothetical protein